MDTSAPAGLDPEIARKLPYSFAKNKGVIAARRDEEVVEIWLRRINGCAATLAEVRRVIKAPLRVKLLDSDTFDKSLEQAYMRNSNGSYQLAVEDIERDLDLDMLGKELPKAADLLEAGEEAPVIRLVNDLFTEALRKNASDIHFELSENRSLVRFRVDGTLHDILDLKANWHAYIISRLKVIANLDIDVKRLPQDGRITLRLAGRPIDVRISSLPTAHGERVVLRLLYKQEGLLKLESLGMSEETMADMSELIVKPHGILLVTGPTGSGKSTTLYAALSRLDMRKLNIMTVEDPIEFDIEGINQTQVNQRIDMTFARALRSILRQDPDVIMIGEIRDLETSRIAVQASLTGHLVFATLHTNDSIGAVIRLVDMGVEPFLLSSSLIGVLAQRLVRKLCGVCKKSYEPDSSERKLLGQSQSSVYMASGCETCLNTGYKGRTGIFELFAIDETLRQLIHDRAAEYKLREHVLDHRKMVTLREDALRLVRKGVTSLDEALLVTEEM